MKRSQPEKTIPRAMRTVTLRLILFYVLSITVMLSMTPWDTMGSGITGQSICAGFCEGRHSLCREDHEPGCHHRRSFQRQHQSLSHQPDPVFAVAGRLCREGARNARQERRTLHCPDRVDRRNGRGHSAGDLRSRAGRSCCFTASRWPECSSSGSSSCSRTCSFAARSDKRASHSFRSACRSRLTRRSQL